MEQTNEPTFVNTKESLIKFVSRGYTVVHSISKDKKMAKGVAKILKETFGEPSGDTPEVGELLEQRIDTWRILHLISKERHSDKPSLENIIKTFKALKNHIVANNIKQVAIPHINCGLDGHTWPCIKYILGQELKGVNVQITICEFRPRPKTFHFKKRPNYRPY